MNQKQATSYFVDRAELPKYFPTHVHPNEFWEALGRAVATFGFLEEVLLKAIFAISVTKKFEESDVEAAFAAWVAQLEQSLTATLWPLVETFEKAVRERLGRDEEMLAHLLQDLRSACVIRNVICHGSWRVPDSEGRSVPFYVNRQRGIFDTPVDLAFLEQTRAATADLACSVIDSVTQLGLQFPGSRGPGEAVWQSSPEGCSDRL